MGEDLKQETLAFVQDVVFSQGRGLKELLTASYTFANSRVGRMYGQNTPAPPPAGPIRSCASSWTPLSARAC